MWIESNIWEDCWSQLYRIKLNFSKQNFHIWNWISELKTFIFETKFLELAIQKFDTLYKLSSPEFLTYA